MYTGTDPAALRSRTLLKNDQAELLRAKCRDFIETKGYVKFRLSKLETELQ